MKIEYLISLALVSIGCLQISCKKNKHEEDTRQFSAVVVNYNTLQPIPNVKILYTRQGIPLMLNLLEPWSIIYADTTTGYNHLPITYWSKDSTYTNANGRFNIWYTPLYLNGTEVSSNSGPVEIPLTFSILTDTLIVAKTNFSGVFSPYTQGADTMFADKKAYLVLKMQKTNPAFANDTVFQFRQFLSPQPPLYFNGGTIFKGQVGVPSRTIIDSFAASIFPKAAIEWRYYRNGVQSSAKDTINLNTTGNRVTQVNIQY